MNKRLEKFVKTLALDKDKHNVIVCNAEQVTEMQMRAMDELLKRRGNTGTLILAVYGDVRSAVEAYEIDNGNETVSDGAVS